MWPGTTTVILWSLRGILILAFILLVWRDFLMLFRRPVKTMGTGLSRVWAVGRTTVLEAWAGRIWLLPVIWVTAAFILIGSVRPFDETERIPLYIRMLLSSQEVLLLVMMWVMACVSLPRERERKIVITNASKPLSRLEMVLGKMVGFWTASALMLLVMAVLSLLILYVSDYRLKSRAATAYELQKQDFAKGFKAPSESLKRLSEEGSLYAYNNITVPREGMSIGAMAFSKDAPPVRFLMGGTYESAIYRFYPNLPMPQFMAYEKPGMRPFFVFFFPPRYPNPAPNPPPVKIHVTAMRSNSHAIPPPRPLEKDLTLNPDGTASWEPDDPAELFTSYALTDPKQPPVVVDERGEVSVQVQCRTPGVYLEILEGADPDPQTGKIPDNVDFNVGFINRESDQAIVPRAHPVSRGFERREREEIAGPKVGEQDAELAVYRFSAQSLKRLPAGKDFTLAFNFETYKQDNFERPTIAAIKVQSLDATGAAPFQTEVDVLEKRLTTIQVPYGNLGDTDPAKRGDLLVIVQCQTPGHSISLLENSVTIDLPRTPFFLNLLKSEAVIFLEAALLIAVSVTCSVRLGWPVAMFCSSVCLGFGYFVDWIIGLQDFGGLSALNYNIYGDPTLTFKILDNLTGLLWKFLGLLAQLLPNFTIYRPVDFISNLQNMPWHVLGANLLDTSLFLLPVIAVAYLLIRKQELG